MRTWYVPSFRGDFRLVAGDDPSTSKLLLLQPTPHERQLIEKFMSVARKKKWTTEVLGDASIDTATLIFNAPLETTGPALVKITKPLDRTLTAVSFKDGRLEVAETGALETLVAKAAVDDDAKAVSVARPTPCCPRCEVGAIEPAREVLQAFMTDQEHQDWADHRAITVRGGKSGHRYLIAHRHSPTAARLKKICYDLDDHIVLHFHDVSVPPEEEVLAAKIILQHREPWLRNEATVLQQDKTGKWYDFGHLRYKNPFGGSGDGRQDAALTAMIGLVGQKLAKVLRS